LKWLDRAKLQKRSGVYKQTWRGDFWYNWRLVVLDPEAAEFLSKSAKPVFDLKNWGFIKLDIEEVT